MLSLITLSLWREVKVYRGENVVDTFFSWLMKDVEDMMKVVRHNVQLIMSDDDNVAFTNATVCHLCERSLTDDDKVRNHCHLTGKFSCNSAHNSCNLSYKMPRLLSQPSWLRLSPFNAGFGEI